MPHFRKSLRRWRQVLIAVIVGSTGLLGAAPTPALAACSLQARASSSGADVTITATATCTSGVQGVRAYVDGNLVGTAQGGNATIPWKATGSAGPRAIVVEASETGDTGWRSPVKTSFSLEVSPPAAAPAAPAVAPVAAGAAAVPAVPATSGIGAAPSSGALPGTTGLMSQVPAVTVPQPSGPCSAQQDAYATMRAETMASLRSLEILRNMKEALDLQHEDMRESIYGGLVIDLAAMAPGWPLGAGVSEKIFGEAAKGLWKDLANAGLKSMQVQALKDPSANAFFDNLTKVEVFEGTTSDLAAEAIKAGITEKVSATAGNVMSTGWDTLKLIRSGYQGWTQLEASRDMLRTVNERILELQTNHVGLMEMADHAQNAISLCRDGVSNADNWRWQTVREHLGLPEATTPAPRPAPPAPTASEPYYAFILDGIGLVVATEREVKETPSCRWRGGGLDCTKTATASSKLGGPYTNSTEAKADLKNKLECFRGYWGDFITIGGKNAWLQNNVGVGDCKSVKQL